MMTLAVGIVAPTLFSLVWIVIIVIFSSVISVISAI